MLFDFAIKRLFNNMCENLAPQSMVTPELLRDLKNFKSVMIHDTELKISKSAIYVSKDGASTKYIESGDFAYLIFSPNKYISECFIDMPTDNEIVEFISTMSSKRNPFEKR